MHPLAMKAVAIAICVQHDAITMTEALSLCRENKVPLRLFQLANHLETQKGN